MSILALRPIVDSDHDALFAQEQDPEAVWMAAFTRVDIGDRAVFEARMAKHLAAEDITMRAITVNGVLVGSIASFILDGRTELTYWIERRSWGRGIATVALRRFLELVTVRPIYARAASDNIGSLKVLQNAGFTVIGTDTGFANARNAEIEETILRKD